MIPKEESVSSRTTISSLSMYSRDEEKELRLREQERKREEKYKMDHRSYRYKHKSGDLYRDRTYGKQKFKKMHPEKRLKKHHHNIRSRTSSFRDRRRRIPTDEEESPEDFINQNSESRSQRTRHVSGMSSTSHTSHYDRDMSSTSHTSHYDKDMSSTSHTSHASHDDEMKKITDKLKQNKIGTFGNDELPTHGVSSDHQQSYEEFLESIGIPSPAPINDDDIVVSNLDPALDDIMGLGSSSSSMSSSSSEKTVANLSRDFQEL